MTTRWCPDCGEADTDPAFWRDRCEAAWWTAQAPEGTAVVATRGRAARCPHSSTPHHAAFVIRTGEIRGVCCVKHIRESMADHAKALRILIRPGRRQ